MQEIMNIIINYKQVYGYIYIHIEMYYPILEHKQ